MNASPSVADGKYTVPKQHVRIMQDADVLLKYNHIDDAAFCFDKILQDTPEFLPALVNLAVIRDLQGRNSEIEPFYQRAIKIAPEEPYLRTYHALHLLSQEKFTEGWEEYKWRLKRNKHNIPAMTGVFDIPYWKGESLSGKRLLIWTEQGIGDEILLSTIFQGLWASKVTVVCTAKMVNLFRSSFNPTDFTKMTFVTRDDILEKGVRPAADYQASLSELGQVLRPSADKFGSPPIILKHPKTHRPWRKGVNIRVGISWISTNQLAMNDKSINLMKWAPVLKTPGIDFINLQYGNDKLPNATLYQEIEGVNKALDVDIRYDTEVTTVDDYAKAITGCDLVISVSNTTVHLAGGFGIPCWNLVPHSKGRIWYWFLKKDYTPWYSSVKLIRRNNYKGADEETLAQVAKDLSSFQVLEQARF